MRGCPKCNKQYPDESVFCGDDGTRLVGTACGKCGGPMQRGFLFRTNSALNSGDMRLLTWLEGGAGGEHISDVEGRGAVQYRVVTYRCGECGSVEIYAVEPQKFKR